MKPYRKTAMFVGFACLFSNVTFILGAILMVESVLGSPDDLSLISAGRAQVVLGVLLSFANGLAYVGIAALLFPVLRPRFESLALAYFGFRLVEFITQILADVSPLALLTLVGDADQTGTVRPRGGGTAINLNQTKIDSVCIQENRRVTETQFLPELISSLSKRGIASEVTSAPPECRTNIILKYSARHNIAS